LKSIVTDISLRTSALALAALVAASLVAAPAAQVVFRSSIQYVAVDVIVTDKDDKPIEDLRQDEFEIVEGGKTQAIKDFQFVSIPAVSRDIAVNVARQPEPDVATNVAPSPTSRLFAIVIDDLHLIEQDTLRLKRVLTELVNMLSPDDEVAMVFVSHSNLGINFTRNTSVIMARINNIKEALGFGLDASGGAPNLSGQELGGRGGVYTATLGPGAGSDGVPDPGFAVKSRMTYARSAAQTLSMVSKSLAGSSHGRRAVFFVTGGTTIDPFTSDFADYLALDFRTLQDEYLKIFTDAKAADVPIYVIDPRGNASPDEVVRGPVTSWEQEKQIRANMVIQHNNMAAIAVNTGGRAIFGASDMPRMMKEIVQENGSYYLLGYYPTPFVADGRFHELKVHVTRPGARVRARAGYEAPSAKHASGPVTESVTGAIAAGVNVSGIPLRAFAEPITSEGKSSRVAVTVEVTYPAPVDGSRRIDDNLELKIVALDPDAKEKSSSSRTLRFAASAPDSGALTFQINEVMVVPSQPLTLRVAVGSQALAKAGTVQLGIDMPKESKGLTLGGIAVGFDGPSREPTMQPNAFGGLIPFQPTTSRVFSPDDTLRLFGHVYWKDKAKASASVTLTGPDGTTSVTPELLPQTGDGNQQDAVIAALLPLKGLRAGKYHLVVSATLPGGKPVSRDVLFEVK